jgi:hypothetical protein
VAAREISSQTNRGQAAARGTCQELILQAPAARRVLRVNAHAQGQQSTPLTEGDLTVTTPAYRAYTVIKREGKDDYWLNLGVAFAHEDGEGFNVLLQAMPVDGKLVLRRYKEDAEEEKPKGKKK